MLDCRAICPIIERVQKRAVRIVYPDLSYREALADANLMSLFERREHLCITLFNQIIESDGQHKLAGLLPQRNTILYKEKANVLYLILTPKGFRILS